MNLLSKPHGGTLTQQILSSNESDLLLKDNKSYFSLSVDFETALEVENIATGVLSPLTGFMKKSDYLSVIKRDRLADDTPWTIPILFHLNEEFDKSIGENNTILLVYNGETFAKLLVEEIFELDLNETAESVFGTTSMDHPGVKQLLSKRNKVIGGRVELIKNVISAGSEYMLSPKETRKIFEQKGWKTVAGFQTRNVIHRAHEYLQRVALEYVDGLFLQPIIGWKKKGDFDPELVMRTYKLVVENIYPPEHVFLSGLPTAMRYAGPKEAIFHAIIRKNYGCTHFIVGRDHAGVGDFYGTYDAHKIFDRFEDLEIVPLRFHGPFYCKKCEGIATDKSCGHPDKFRLEIAGTLIREILSNDSIPSNDIFRPEILSFLQEESKKRDLFNT